MSNTNLINMCDKLNGNNASENWKRMIVDILVAHSKTIEEFTDRIDQLELDITELEERNCALETYVIELENDIYGEILSDEVTPIEPVKENKPEKKQEPCKCGDPYCGSATTAATGTKNVFTNPNLYRFYIYDIANKKYKI